MGRYYLVIKKDGKLEDISVSCATYNEFKVGYFISLTHYEGFLNVEYYEYVPSSKYNKPFT